jgi:type VI secretion system secreted protein Hcp
MSAIDYFLKIDGIEGESKDVKMKGAIDIESWSWGESQGGTGHEGGGHGAGKVSMQDFHFTMKMNKASPRLFLHCCTGKPCKTAVLTCRKAGLEQQQYLVVTFSDVLVSSFHMGGSAHHADPIPSEQISLNFAKIEVEYKQQKADGSLAGAVRAGWNVKENRKV